MKAGLSLLNRWSALSAHFFTECITMVLFFVVAYFVVVVVVVVVKRRYNSL